MDEPKPIEKLIPLKPHSYPVPILLFTGLVMVIFVYSTLFLVPRYRETYHHLAQADKALGAQAWDSASAEYKQVLSDLPGSKYAKFGLAKSLFANSNKEDDIDALVVLEGLEIDKTDWSSLQKYMPEEYKVLFSTIKR